VTEKRANVRWQADDQRVVVVAVAVYLPGGVVVVYKDWRHRLRVNKVVAEQEAQGESLVTTGGAAK